MSSPDQAIATQISNIEKKTGKSLAELKAAIEASGLQKHGERRTFAKETFGLGAGDANTLVHVAFATDGASAAKAAGATADAILDDIYAGPKAAQRPIHEALMAIIEGLGDFETAPKKGYVSLRRKKQFAMLGPKTNTRFELGLNIKGEAANARAVAQKPGGMCQYVVALTGAAEVDADIAALLRQAFDQAG
jgi:hypothetical protein